MIAPDGARWRVRRLWTPRGESLWARARRRFRSAARRNDDTPSDAGEALSGGELGDLVIGLTVGLLVLALIFVVLPLVLVILDLLVVLLLVVAGALGRIVFRRPWVVEAACQDGRRHTWQVVGWRDSRARCDEVAQLLAAGLEPPAPDPP